jgi:hypothetical protein
MKKINLLLFLIGGFFLNINAQEIISSSGNYFENSNGSISMTIGEPITETFSNESNILTQGFQQSRLMVVSIFDLQDNGFVITIAPNPTLDFINLNMNNFEDISYQLSDFNGKVMKEAKVYSEQTNLSFTDYSGGVYFLNIRQGSKLIKTLQIIKQ